MKPNLTKKATEGGIISALSVGIINLIIKQFDIPSEYHNEILIIGIPALHAVFNSLRVKIKHFLNSKKAVG